MLCGAHSIKDIYPTGSYPLPPQGWQRLIRFIPSHIPFQAPYFFIASSAYCEQVGVYLQAIGKKGEMLYL